MKHFDDDAPDINALGQVKDDLQSSISKHSSGLGGLILSLSSKLSKRANWVIGLLVVNGILMLTNCVLLGMQIFNK